MPTVCLVPLYHRRQESIAVRFTMERELERLVRTLPLARWSQTHRTWYIPLTKAHYRALVDKLTAAGVGFDAILLKRYLEQRKTLLPTPLGGRGAVINQGQAALLLNKQLCAENLEAYRLFMERLTLKAYSPSTIRTYRTEFLSLLRILGKQKVEELNVERLRSYLLYCTEQEKLSEATIHSRINALKFYFEKVLSWEPLFFELPRPKKPLKLPKVLGEEELQRLFNAIGNRKHKAILFTAYSAGLRVSEVVQLKLSHVDSDRMQLFIERAKGKKDRVVNLSPVLLDVLRGYVKAYRPRPQVYLFEGLLPGQPYSDTSAQRVFQQARHQAGIKKEVSFHSLRHSFATHMLEKGVDIRYIKDILGHFNIKTTERYLHVRKEQLVTLPSPLDDLWKKGDIEW